MNFITQAARTALVCIALTIGGCLTPGGNTGRDFEESKAPQIVPGMTKTEVVGLLGQPVSTYKNGDQEQWSYQSTAVDSNAGAIGAGTTAVASVAAMAVPVVGSFLYLGATAAGLGVMNAAQRTTTTAKHLQVSFKDGKVASCQLMLSVSDSRAAGPKSGTEVSYCGGPAPSAQFPPMAYNNPAAYAAMQR